RIEQFPGQRCRSLWPVQQRHDVHHGHRRSADPCHRRPCRFQLLFKLERWYCALSSTDSHQSRRAILAKPGSARELPSRFALTKQPGGLFPHLRPLVREGVAMEMQKPEPMTLPLGFLLNIYSGAPGGPSGWMLGTNGVGAYDGSTNLSGKSYQSTAP